MTRIRSTFAVFASAILALVFVSPALAVEYGGVSAAPAHPDGADAGGSSWFVYRLSPGTGRTDALAVTNGSDAEVALDVYAVDAATAPGAAGLKHRADEQTAVGSWVTISGGSVTIPSEGSAVVPFSIAIPDNAPIGTYEGGIVVENHDGSVSAFGGIPVSSRIAVSIYITVASNGVAAAPYSVVPEGQTTPHYLASSALTGVLGLAAFAVENGRKRKTVPKKAPKRRVSAKKKPAKKTLKRKKRVVTAAFAIAFLLAIPAVPLSVHAAMSSANFKVPSDSLNDGGGDTSSSASFKTFDTVGETGAGLESSASFKAQTGYRVGTPTPVVPPPPPPGGGGGGGGGSPPPPPSSAVTVTFTGWASPSAFIEARVDTVRVASTTAAGDGSFSLSTTRTGAYTVTFVATDVNGRASSLDVVVNASSSQSSTIANILLPPSLQVSASVVRIGDRLIAGGSVAAGAGVDVVFTPTGGSPLTQHVVADTNGAYGASFATAGLPEGPYTVSATESLSSLSSSTTVSGRLSFTAPPTNANLPVTQPGVECANVGDLNCDKKTNLQDVSILLFYFGKSTFPAYLDLNKDGKINLVDFSILLFYWT